MRINICFASDDNYSKHMAVVIASILKNAKARDELFFYVLDGGISPENKEKIESLKKIKNFEINFIKVDSSLFIQFPLVIDYITITTYYRYLISSLLPNIDKVLYLDCDLIVKSSLEELYSVDISDYWLAGVEDLGYLLNQNALNSESKTFYVNAGVLLVNLKKWREDGIEKKLFDYTFENKDKLICNDQDVLNMVLTSKIKPLDRKWNVQNISHVRQFWRNHPCVAEINKSVMKPSIIHYAGKSKPWDDPLFVHYALEYLKYTKLPPWKNDFISVFELKIECLKSIIKVLFTTPLDIFSLNFLKKSRLARKQILLSKVDFGRINKE